MYIYIYSEPHCDVRGNVMSRGPLPIAGGITRVCEWLLDSLSSAPFEKKRESPTRTHSEDDACMCWACGAD